MRSILSITLLLFANDILGYLLPSPPGKHNVTVTTGTLVDYTRNDTYNTKQIPRALMLSVFRPANCNTTIAVPYMPNKTAEYQGSSYQKLYNISANLSSVFLDTRLPVCPEDESTCITTEDSPILLFSPGFGVSRLYYNVIASAIASEGFIVITIDHPHDASIITYPDGHAIYSNASSNLTTEQINQYVYTRVADASFVINQLSNATAMSELLPQRGPRAFPTDQVAMLGHSLGGDTSVIAAGQDPRIRGAINWDGTLYGSLPASGLSQPVLLMSHANSTDPSWLEAWPQLKGPKLWVTVANTEHMTFSDVPSLLEASGLGKEAFTELVGTIEGAKMVDILTAYTTEWMKGVFAGKVGGPLLQGEDPERFPEATIVSKGNF